MQPGIRGMAGIIRIGQSRQVEHEADLDLRRLSEVGVTRIELHDVFHASSIHLEPRSLPNQLIRPFPD
jgi:hypothetical protein